MKAVSFISLFILFLAQPSMALFEVRAGYGLIASKPNLAGFYTGSSSDFPSAAPNLGLTLDAIATVPLVGIGGGLRMENMKVSYDSSLLGISNQLNRTSLIVNYRIINTLIYLGPIMTYGLSHSNSLKISSGGTTISDISSSKVSSYSLGLEAGAGLLGFMAGAEIGTMMMSYKDAKDSLNPSRIHTLNMSGTYAKLFVGFGI